MNLGHNPLSKDKLTTSSLNMSPWDYFLDFKKVKFGPTCGIYRGVYWAA
jgi:hypothetical protein